MPETFLISSTDRKAPCSSLYEMMASALVFPIPDIDVSPDISAVLILTLPEAVDAAVDDPDEAVPATPCCPFDTAPLPDDDVPPVPDDPVPPPAAICSCAIVTAWIRSAF